ncbi:ankyrin repeat domain-containing protein [Stenotrophomonas acidaminiphila]
MTQLHTTGVDELMIKTVITQDNAEILTHAFENGVSPNTSLMYYTSPLVMACSSEAYECMKVLIRKNADIYVKDEYENTLLHNISCIRNRSMLEGVEYFVNQGVRLEAKNLIGNTALHAAAETEDVAKCMLLLDMGADVHAKNQELNTPLFLTTSRMIAEALIAYGANPNHRNAYGETPLHCCTSFQCLKALVDGGADVNALNTVGESPLFSMLALGTQDSYDSAIYMIKKGAVMDINQIDTALMQHNAYFDDIYSFYEMYQNKRQQERLMDCIEESSSHAKSKTRKL